MKYPKLVPPWVCTIPITLEVESEGITEDGEPNGTVTFNGKCNFQDGGRVIYTADQKRIYISGRAYFDGDILPDVSNITGGYAYVNGNRREIYQGYKRRDPDGNVNYTEIQFK